MINYKEIGQLAEYEIAVKLGKQGYRVSVPLIDNYPYDLIVDTGEKLFKVQVKTCSSSRIKKDKSKNYGVLIAQGKANKGAYSPKDVDIFAIRIEEHDTWYFIPITETNGKKKLILFPHVVNSTEQYFKYRNNYSAFE